MKPLRPRELLLSLKHGTVEACFSVPMLNLTLTQFSFVVAFAVEGLGWRSGAIGWLAAIHHLCNAAQPPLMWLLRRHLSLHRIIVWGFVINVLPWTFMGFLPYFGNARDAIFAGVVVVSTLGNSVCGVAWSAAMGELVPLHLRGRYFGQRNMLYGFWTLLAVLAAGFIADHYDNALTVFAMIFATASALRLIGLYYFLRMRFPESVLQPLAQREQWTDYLNVFRARQYLWLLAFVGLWGFALNLAQPFYSVYILRFLPLTISDLTVLTTVHALGGLFLLPTWGKLSDRFGSKPVMMACAVVWIAVGLPAWLMAGPDRTAHLYPTYFLVGAATAGFQLCQFNLMVKMIPARTTAPFISVFLAGISLMSAAGPLVGGQLLMHLPHEIGTLLDQPLLRFHVIFVGSLVLGMLSIHVLQQLQEPNERPLSELVRVMQRMREFNPVLGLAHLAETVFTPRRLSAFASQSWRTLRRQADDFAEVGEDLADAGWQAVRRRLRTSESPPTPPAPSDSRPPQ